MASEYSTNVQRIFEIMQSTHAMDPGRLCPLLSKIFSLGNQVIGRCREHIDSIEIRAKKEEAQMLLARLETKCLELSVFKNELESGKISVDDRKSKQNMVWITHSLTKGSRELFLHLK